MPDCDVKRVNLFDRETSRPIGDLVGAPAGRADLPTDPVSVSGARVIRQADAEQLISVESGPVEGEARLGVSLQVGGLRLRILTS